METPPPRRIIRGPKVCDLTGNTMQTIRRAVKNGTFPLPVSLGLRSVGWYADEVDAWIAARPRAPVSKAGCGTPAPKPGGGKPKLTLVSSVFRRLTGSPDQEPPARSPPEGT
jgi:prophage regulatory protein